MILVVDDGGGVGAGLTKIDLGIGILEILLPGGRSRDFADRPVVSSADMTSPVEYDKWGAMTLLEKYWDYDRSFTGSSAGTLRVAVRVRAVDASVKFDPANIQTFQSMVSRLAIAQAQEFAASIKDRGQRSIPTILPEGFRREIVGIEEWVAYDRKDSGTKIFTRPLDSSHFIEVMFSYISNSKTDSWIGSASSDAKKILSTVCFVRR